MEFKKTGFKFSDYTEIQKPSFSGNKPSNNRRKNRKNGEEVKTSNNPSFWQKLKKVRNVASDENIDKPYFINPKTGKFDRKLFELKKYFEEESRKTNSVTCGHLYNITDNLPLMVNKTTGEIDKRAVDFVYKTLVYPYTSDGKKIIQKS